MRRDIGLKLFYFNSFKVFYCDKVIVEEHLFYILIVIKIYYV